MRWLCCSSVKPPPVPYTLLTPNTQASWPPPEQKHSASSGPFYVMFLLTRTMFYLTTRPAAVGFRSLLKCLCQGGLPWSLYLKYICLSLPPPPKTLSFFPAFSPQCLSSPKGLQILVIRLSLSTRMQIRKGSASFLFCSYGCLRNPHTK